MEEECKNSWADESAKEENRQHDSNNLHDIEEDQINTSNSFSKPPGFEGFTYQKTKSVSNKSKLCRRNSMAYSFVAASNSQSGKTISKKLQSNGLLIEALISQIELGSVLGYDTEGSKADLQKYIQSIETHSQNIDSFKVNQLWGNYHFDFVDASSIGRSGGLLSVWDPSAFTKFHDRLKQSLWQSLLLCMNNNLGNYIIFDDFNVVRFGSERIGSIFNHSSAIEFNHFILKGNLCDLPLGGHAFTYISSNGDKLSKLDRFLISDGITSIVPNLYAMALDLMISDHRPILLHQLYEDFGPIPFKFCNSWMLHPQFDCMIHLAWEQTKSLTEKFKKFEGYKVTHRSRHYASLGETQNAFLEADVSELEIQNEIWDCRSDKSPGSDGFSLASIRGIGTF
ncbi:RNA-directed DNA polymerase, eukaryota, reverse transcriptase zinc-binding domain protein [Tanacetum coccineum]|uniref:RNA-directed DNA polymerase, eukaryota, reverse transcriptase zinc-binding domain protein n=1 Tax=Tanacetum coccineum TaxID=301880 RepID=A0ABQ5BHH0_9ASTR